MQDIFNRDQSRLNGVFTADRVKLTMPNKLGTLVQQFQASYAQTITRLYEVGSNDEGSEGKLASNTYYVGGRTQGNLSLGRVVGPGNTIKTMYTTYGDVCDPQPIYVELTETNCLASNSTSVQLTYAFKNAVIQQVGLSVAAQDMIINENISMMFSSMSAQ